MSTGVRYVIQFADKQRYVTFLEVATKPYVLGLDDEEEFELCQKFLARLRARRGNRNF